VGERTGDTQKRELELQHLRERLAEVKARPTHEIIHQVIPIVRQAEPPAPQVVTERVVTQAPAPAPVPVAQETTTQSTTASITSVVHQMPRVEVTPPSTEQLT